MASRLEGLHRTLTWADFPTVQRNPPGAGGHASGAFTHTSYRLTPYLFRPEAGAQRFALVDNVVVTIDFTRARSWVANWVATRPPPFSADLLNHEQGHYAITALCARDFFVDLMCLKPTVFDTASAGLNAVADIKRRTLDRIPSIQASYDREVHPEQNGGVSRGPIQLAWDGYIRSAFTIPRSPPSNAPDGVTHKIRLVDVLTRAGRPP
jgi:hypothetical protein